MRKQTSTVKFANKVFLSYEHNWSMSNLYLPLIGMDSFSLYHLMIVTADAQTELTNNNIFNLLNISPDKLREITEKLEALDLIHTFIDKSNDEVITKLKKPYVPAKFLNDIQKKEYLKRTVGETTFNFIYQIAKKQFGDETSTKENLVDVSTEFSNVFESIVLNSENVDSYNNTQYNNFKTDLISELEKQHLPINISDIAMKDLWKIQQMYNPTMSQFIKSYMVSLGQNGLVNISVFTETIKKIVMVNLNAKSNVQQGTSIGKTTGPDKNLKTDSKPSSLEQMLEMMSPLEFLKFQAKSASVADTDKRLVLKLQNNFGFSQGVINALLFYVLKTTNNKLPGAFVDKIAGEWQRKQIKTTKQALDLIKPQKQNQSNGYYNKKDEAIPQWMKDKQQKQTQASENKPAATDEKMSEEETARKIEQGKREFDKIMKGIGW